MARLTEKKRKAIVKDYQEYGTYAKVARKHKVSPATVKKLVCGNRKPLEDAASRYDIMEHLSKNSKAVCDIIDRYLAVMNDPERLANAPLNQVASSLGVLVDRFSKSKKDDSSHAVLEKLIEAVKQIE